jgi:hypothetical protein
MNIKTRASPGVLRQKVQILQMVRSACLEGPKIEGRIILPPTGWGYFHLGATHSTVLPSRTAQGAIRIQFRRKGGVVMAAWYYLGP